MFGLKPIPELDNQLRNVLKYSGCILVGIGLGLFFYPSDGMLWGLAIGLGTGIYNSIVLAVRIKRLPDLSPEKGNKHIKKGMAMRLTMIIAVLFFVSTRLSFVSLFGVGAGLLVPYCVSTIAGVVDTIRGYRQSEAFARKFSE
ncbi:MAG: ATP synthase subunit I [Actinobacteria bacterium]|nr:ATP synthase subunit I [Actinomycetota bacterium]